MADPVYSNKNNNNIIFFLLFFTYCACYWVFEGIEGTTEGQEGSIFKIRPESCLCLA